MARSLFLLALLMASSAAPTPVQAQNQIPLPPFLTPRGTPEDQRNCRPDAVKLCKDQMGNDDQTLRCFQANRHLLSHACRGVLEKYGR